MSYRTRNIAIASGLALLAIVFMVVYVSKARNGSAADVGKGLVSVLFAAQDIHAGTPGSTLQHGALVTKEVPQSAAVPDSITSPRSVAGQVATQDILAGEPVTTRKFGPIAAAGVRSRIEGLQRVVQLSGDKNQVLDGTLQPGDRVDIVGSWNVPENCGTCHVSRVIVPNVLVVGTSAEIGASDQQGQAPVQLRLTDDQVASVFWVSKNGDWWLALRPVVKPRTGSDGVENSITLLKGKRR
jgi:Flp pilus assembly protein CpaB